MSDDDLRRRRRLTSNGPRRTSGKRSNVTPWLVTIAAAIAVIVGGWFLGQALAHILNPTERSTQVAQQPTPLSVTPLPSASPGGATATPLPSPSPTPKPTQKPTEKPSPTAKPLPTPTLAAVVVTTAPPTPAQVATEAPTAAPTEAPRKVQPVTRRPETTPAAAAQAPSTPEGDEASRTVRAYIEALRDGDPQAASVYLGNGSPDEGFIDSSTRITNVSSTRNSDGSYKVEVNMKTAQGEYYETFVVASTPNGNRILDKTAIKP